MIKQPIASFFLSVFSAMIYNKDIKRGKNMNPLQIIEMKSSSFTKTELMIKDFVVDNLVLIATKTILDVAKEIPTSKSALLRFCQKCDYTGYSNFKYEISRYLYSQSVDNTKNNSKFGNIMNSFSDSILLFNETICSDQLLKLAKDIKKARYIKIYGVNETGLAAKQLYYRLSTLGIDSEYIHESGTIYSKPLLTNSKNVIHIYFSLSAETAVIKESVKNCIESNQKYILITQNQNAKLSKNSLYTFIIPQVNTHKAMYLNPQLLNFFFVELLISAISLIL